MYEYLVKEKPIQKVENKIQKKQERSTGADAIQKKDTERSFKNLKPVGNIGSTDMVIQRMPCKDLFAYLIRCNPSLSIDQEVLRTKFNEIILKTILETRNPYFVEILDFVESESDDGGGAQFIPLKPIYRIEFNHNYLWKKCKMNIGFSKKDDVGFDEQKQLSTFTMVLANIAHEITHASVAFFLHNGKGITEDEYSKKKELDLKINSSEMELNPSEKKQKEIIDKKYIEPAQNTVLESINIVSGNKVIENIINKLEEFADRSKFRNTECNLEHYERNYLRERIKYMKSANYIEIDSVLTDLSIFFNMQQPEHNITYFIKRFSHYCQNAKQYKVERYKSVQEFEQLLTDISNFIENMMDIKNKKEKN